MSESNRLLVGIAAVALVVAGAGVVVLTDERTNGEVLIRVGVLLAAVWLVAPLVRRPGPASVVLMAIAVLVVLRPRLIFPVAVAALLWRLARRG